MFSFHQALVIFAFACIATSSASPVQEINLSEYNCDIKQDLSNRKSNIKLATHINFSSPIKHSKTHLFALPVVDAAHDRGDGVPDDDGGWAELRGSLGAA